MADLEVPVRSVRHGGAMLTSLSTLVVRREVACDD